MADVFSVRFTAQAFQRVPAKRATGGFCPDGDHLALVCAPGADEILEAGEDILAFDGFFARCGVWIIREWQALLSIVIMGEKTRRFAIGCWMVEKV